MKKLAFKGERPKKRKRLADDDEQRANALNNEDDGTNWVNAESQLDFNGPLLLAFASESGPAALACDPMGKVFASVIEHSHLHSDEEEDGGDEDQSAPRPISNVEPADVRQVWIASKITGTVDKIALRSFQGKFLSCDKVGILSATREAISPQEEWMPVQQTGDTGLFGLRNVSEKFLSLEEKKGRAPEVRADADALGFKEAWRVRIQARNRHVLQAGNSNTGGAGVVHTGHISRRDLEQRAGRKLTYEEATELKHAWKHGRLNEALLDLRVKSSRHDKFG